LDTGIKIGVAYFLLTAMLYFAFVYKKKFLEIAKYYESEPSKKRNRGKIFAISYIIFSFLLMISCFYLMIKKNKGEL
jgi:hypothetical protein